MSTEQAEAHANFKARQVEVAAKAKLEEFQEQAKQQVASKIDTIQEKEEEHLLLRQAADQREAQLLAEGQQLQGQVAGFAKRQQEDTAQISHHAQLLQDKDAQTQDLQARLDHLHAQHNCTLAAQGGDQQANQARTDAQLADVESRSESVV